MMRPLVFFHLRLVIRFSGILSPLNRDSIIGERFLYADECNRLLDLYGDTFCQGGYELFLQNRRTCESVQAKQ